MKKSETSAFGTVSRINHDSKKFYKGRLYGTRKASSRKNGEPQENTPKRVNVIHRSDSRSMQELPNESVHLMITSPPYNVGKEYDADLSLSEYKGLISGVMQETYRVLVEGGRACINIANVGRTPYIPLHAHLIEISHDCGFFMRGEIIWDKGASAGTSCAWGSWKSSSNPVLRDVHEYILVFCKKTFARRPIRQDSIGRDDFLECTKSIWRFPAASAKKSNHPAPFPLELPLRLIHLYSFVGDIVLDPFLGSGTTAEAALRSDRKYVGYEISEEYVSSARERMAGFSKRGNAIKRKKPPRRKAIKAQPASSQPTEAELRQDISIPTTPDTLLNSVFKYNPNN